MHLRAELVLVALLAAALPCSPAAAQAEAGQPTRKEVEKALDRVASDPNLVPERTVSMLRWAEQESPSSDEPMWVQWLQALVRWLRGLFAWLAVSGRYGVWVLGAILAALLVLYLARLVGARGGPRARKPTAPPSHVRDLDIRPESLPDDVGAEALALWRRGQERAALALLYRGLLSRLVHEHGVPIRASSTEGECLALAPSLPTPSAAYAVRLVRVWQAAVYGGLSPMAGAVEALCAEFSTALARGQTQGDA